jgi:hypothetical protein
LSRTVGNIFLFLCGAPFTNLLYKRRLQDAFYRS